MAVKRVEFEVRVVPSFSIVTKFVRCYLNRKGGISLVVLDKLPDLFPASTMDVFQVDFQLHTRKDGVKKYLRLGDEELQTLRRESGISDLTFNGTYFVSRK